MKIDGKELEIQPARFADVMKLKYNIGKALSVKSLDLGGVEVNSEDPLKSDIGSDTLGSLLENIINVATDEKVMGSLFDCCDKIVLFDSYQVNREFFEDPATREYYYPIMLEVIKVNIMPFFGKISSMFSGAGELMGKFQKQK